MFPVSTLHSVPQGLAGSRITPARKARKTDDAEGKEDADMKAIFAASTTNAADALGWRLVSSTQGDRQRMLCQISACAPCFFLPNLVSGISLNFDKIIYQFSARKSILGKSSKIANIRKIAIANIESGAVQKYTCLWRL